MISHFDLSHHGYIAVLILTMALGEWFIRVSKIGSILKPEASLLSF